MSTFTTIDTSQDKSLNVIIYTTLGAGALSLAVWEIWANVFAPLYMGGPLSPVGLIKSSFGIGKETFAPFLAAKSNSVGNAFANAVHLFTGLVAYPLAYIIANHLTRPFSGQFSWWLKGAIYGVGLYIFAMYIMAHFFAGFPPFFGFNALSQASFIGHVLVGLSIAGSVDLINKYNLN